MGKQVNIPSFKVNFPTSLKKTMLENISGVLDSGMLASGKYVKSCEEKIREITKAKYVYMTASGSSALEVIANTLKNRHGLGTVLIPYNTFVSTSFAFEKVGFKIKFYKNSFDQTFRDINGTFNGCVGLVVVDLGGRIPTDIEKAIKFVHKKGMWVIEDACQAFGSELNGKFAGTFADMGAYSFFGTKVLTSAEGGAVVTNNPIYAKEAELYRNFGNIDRSPTHYTRGWNCLMDDIRAGILLPQLENWDKIVSDRSGIRLVYRKALKKDLEFLPDPENSFFNGYKVIAFLKKVDRGKFIEACKKEGVRFQGNVYDLTLPEQPVYREREEFLGRGNLGRMICLPSWYGMKKEEIDYIVRVIKKVLKEVR